MESVQIQWIDIREHILEVAEKNVQEGMNMAAKEGARYLQNTSPVDNKGVKPGKYARGWRAELINAAGRTGEAYIYNKTDWQLTHLLEDGHDLYNRFGGPYPPGAKGTKHIYYAEGYVYGILDRKLRISRGLY